MPRITPKDERITHLAGLHLWHATMSSCSQRVRLVLAEARQDYESHVLNLERGEHATASYHAVRPKGIVPALVDDGGLYIESIDIIRHLARDCAPLNAQCDDTLLDRVDDAQADLKLLTFEFLFRAKPAPSQDGLKSFYVNHQNAWIRQFYNDFGSGFGRDRIAPAVQRTHQGFAALESRLAYGNLYLSENSFGLTDIAWLPNLHRMALMGWSFDHLPYLSLWIRRVEERSGHCTALLDWQGEHVVGAFENYTQRRRKAGTDVCVYLRKLEDASERKTISAH